MPLAGRRRHSGPLYISLFQLIALFYIKKKKLILNLFSCHRSLWKFDKVYSSESECVCTPALASLKFLSLSFFTIKLVAGFSLLLNANADRSMAFLFTFFFPFIFISWRLIILEYCSGFCHTLTWISHWFTCITHPDPPSHLSLHPPPTSLSTRFLWVFPVHQARALVSCIQPGLVICFTLDNMFTLS